MASRLTCDRHPSAKAVMQALAWIEGDLRDLLFCGHCTNRHQAVLEKQGFTIIHADAEVPAA